MTFSDWTQIGAPPSKQGKKQKSNKKARNRFVSWETNSAPREEVIERQRDMHYRKKKKIGAPAC